MISEDEIIDTLNINKIIKRFPKSGQKQTFLVDSENYGIVVLKLVLGDNERIKREIEIVEKNNFSNVPKMLEVEYVTIGSERYTYIFEEYIEGQNLKEFRGNRSISLSDAIDLTEQLLQIIMQMETKKIVHRDIKPDNILRSINGTWYLIDFGIARAMEMDSLTLTSARIEPHTPGYGAPELFQYAKREIDSRADIFSLGVVVFEALTGHHPFLNGDELDLNEIWYRTVTIMPKLIQIEGDKDMMFVGLLQTFMQKQITRRPRSAKKAYDWFLSVKNYIEE